ncbi:unnamed protein product (macronuclear) [Paramecium tetraurelia]|uniref:Cyclic nucleotide-binding domain-containing protein n=1 Tax=Paramecium tetraurelia TaxID=5888 RepID=A0D0B0_PARTE|nr:uncharacterized protein GSPATT00012029001 [Paramecium tetraurelia]CAK76477.1 unnamed protein product [Paramecium tetraurelia]|eukprot:XP_001443874.1 hypothetical protein (macronuclear) [Paramecium tetraurelia strain d4-2]
MKETNSMIFEIAPFFDLIVIYVLQDWLLPINCVILIEILSNESLVLIYSDFLALYFQEDNFLYFKIKCLIYKYKLFLSILLIGIFTRFFFFSVFISLVKALYTEVLQYHYNESMGRSNMEQQNESFYQKDIILRYNQIMQQEESRIINEYLKKLLRKEFYDTTPELNDCLYLHSKGFEKIVIFKELTGSKFIYLVENGRQIQEEIADIFMFSTSYDLPQQGTVSDLVHAQTHIKFMELKHYQHCLLFLVIYYH